MEISVDLRFCEIERELWALEEFVEIVERQIPNVKTLETKLTHDQLKTNGLADDEAEVSMVLQELHDKVNNIVPRFFRGQILMTLWAVYQGTTHEIAEYIKKEKNLTRTLDEVKGNSDLAKLRKYFADELCFPLSTDKETENRLEMLVLIRNIIAHSNGRMDEKSCRPSRRKQIEQLHKYGVLISQYPESLMFTETFLRTTCTIVCNSLHELINRVRSNF